MFECLEVLRSPVTCQVAKSSAVQRRRAPAAMSKVYASCSGRVVARSGCCDSSRYGTAKPCQTSNVWRGVAANGRRIQALSVGSPSSWSGSRGGRRVVAEIRSATDRGWGQVVHTQTSEHGQNIGPSSKVTASLVLVSYNQVDFVRDAVRGALAQTYRPLELIVADDGSTDGTVDAISDELKAAPADLPFVFLRSDLNRGLARNVNSALAIVRGSVIVMAAGDDVSLPWRVSDVVEMFGRGGGHVAMGCGRRIIDAAGRPIRDDPWGFTSSSVRRDQGKTGPLSYARTLFPMVPGCASAFLIRVHTEFGPLSEDVVLEDIVYGFRCQLLGSVGQTNRIGVLYRTHATNLSAVSMAGLDFWGRLRAREAQHRRALWNHATVYRAMRRDLHRYCGRGRQVMDFVKIDATLKRMEFTFRMLHRQLGQRIGERVASLFKLISAGAPRLFVARGLVRIAPQPVMPILLALWRVWLQVASLAMKLRRSGTSTWETLR